MNVEIRTDAPIFFFWEYLFQIFGILSLQCMAQDVFIMRLANPFRGTLEEVGPESWDFIGPKKSSNGFVPH